MQRKYGNAEQAMNVAKEAVYLAWQACGSPMGMGVFQDRGPKQDRDTVWDHAYSERDYAPRQRTDVARVSCDYVMGRMMKLSFRVDGDTITHNDYECRHDYQSWCGTYPSFAALFDAAEDAAGLKREAQAA